MLKTILSGILLILFCTQPVGAIQKTDALNRQVAIPDNPQRIISLVPSVTEILFQLGLEEHLVAVTDACTYPEAALKLPNVGNYADPGLEAILLFKPDLVIAAADMNRPALIRRLELLDIPVYVTQSRTVAETLETIETIGIITGGEKQGKQLANSLRQRIREIQHLTAELTPPTTLACVMLQPLTVAGPDTFINDIISLAGGKNIVPRGPSRYPTWNSEALLTANPQTIVVSTYPGQPNPEYFFSKWPQLQAVKNHRIIRIEADWIHRPGPRLILGIEALAKAFHPDVEFNE